MLVDQFNCTSPIISQCEVNAVVFLLFVLIEKEEPCLLSITNEYFFGR